MTEPALPPVPAPVDSDKVQKAPDAYRTISEVADELHIPQHRLRSWETLYPGVKPLRGESGRRYYSPDHIETLKLISDLLYVQGYKSQGVLRVLKERRAHRTHTAPDYSGSLSMGAEGEVDVPSSAHASDAAGVTVAGAMVAGAMVGGEVFAAGPDTGQEFEAGLSESSAASPSHDEGPSGGDEIAFPESPRVKAVRDVFEPLDFEARTGTDDAALTDSLQRLRDENENLSEELEKSRVENGYLRSEMREILEELRNLRNLLPV